MSALSDLSAGVIGGAPVVAAAAPAPAAAVDQSITQAAQAGPIMDLALPQLPADMPPVEQPEFTIARKEFDDSGNHAATPHFPGLGGLGHDDGAAMHTAGYTGSPLMDGANGVLDGAQSALIGAGQTVDGALHNAQTALEGAQTALTGGTPGGTPAASAVAAPAAPSAPATTDAQSTAANTAAATTGTATDPISQLLSSLHLPSIPNIEQLFQPLASLLQSFGTGSLSSLGSSSPTNALNSSSSVIQQVMSIAEQALKAVESSWTGQSADAAQTSGQSAQSHSQTTVDRGTDISNITSQAAGVVQNGNAQLTAVTNAFVAQATALAPVAWTPPGQAALISAATDSLSQAVAVVNATRGELGTYTGQLAGVVNDLVAQNAPAALQEAATVAQNVAEPLLSDASQSLTNGTSTTTGTNPSSTTTGLPSLGTQTTTAGFPGTTTTGDLGSLGSLGSPSLSTGPGSPGSPSIPGLPGSPSMPAGPGIAIPGLTAGLPNSTSGLPLGATGGSTGTPGSGFMGTGAAAGANRNQDDEEHTSKVQPYFSPAGNDDLTGALGEASPDIIGATNTEDVIDGYDPNGFQSPGSTMF